MKTDQPFSLESTLLRCRNLASFCADKGSTEVKLDIRDFNNLMSCAPTPVKIDEDRTHDAGSAVNDEPTILEMALQQMYNPVRGLATFEADAIRNALIFANASAAAAGSQMLDMQGECISLRVALATARDQFKDYQRHHQAKADNDAKTIKWREDNNMYLDENPHTERRKADSEAKAKRNLDMVTMCQAAIDSSRRVVPSVDPEPGDAAATVKTIRAAAEGGMVDSIASGILAVSAGVSVER